MLGGGASEAATQQAMGGLEIQETTMRFRRNRKRGGLDDGQIYVGELSERFRGFSWY
jgi:hypothetical protein